MEIENRTIQMSPNELQNLAATSQLAGQVLLASAFIEPLFSGNFSFKGLVIGFFLSVIFFLASFLLAKKIDSKI